MSKLRPPRGESSQRGDSKKSTDFVYRITFTLEMVDRWTKLNIGVDGISRPTKVQGVDFRRINMRPRTLDEMHKTDFVQSGKTNVVLVAMENNTATWPYAESMGFPLPRVPAVLAWNGGAMVASLRDKVGGFEYVPALSLGLQRETLVKGETKEEDHYRVSVVDLVRVFSDRRAPSAHVVPAVFNFSAAATQAILNSGSKRDSDQKVSVSAPRSREKKVHEATKEEMDTWKREEAAAEAKEEEGLSDVEELEEPELIDPADMDRLAKEQEKQAEEKLAALEKKQAAEVSGMDEKFAALLEQQKVMFESFMEITNARKKALADEVQAAQAELHIANAHSAASNDWPGAVEHASIAKELQKPKEEKDVGNYLLNGDVHSEDEEAAAEGASSARQPTSAPPSQGKGKSRAPSKARARGRHKFTQGFSK